MAKHLVAHILPTSTSNIFLEYEDTASKVSKTQSELENKIYSAFQNNYFEALFYLGASSKEIPLSPSMNYFRIFAHRFIEGVYKTPDLELLRNNLSLPTDTEYLSSLLEKAPFIQGAEYLNLSVLTTLWHSLNQCFQQEIESFKGSVQDFFQQFSPNIHLIGKIFFHLVENKEDEEHPFAFLATYAAGVEKGKSKHRPLKYALTEYEDDQKKMLELLITVNNAAKKSTFLADILNNGDIFYPLSWTACDAFNFLKDVNIFEEAGVLCRIPNWWKKKTHRPRLDITVGDKQPSLLGMESLTSFEANLVIDGTPLSIEEIRALLEESEGLAYLKGKWITVDKDSLKKTLSSWEKAQTIMQDKNITLSEALRLLMSSDSSSKKLGFEELADENVEVSCGKWLESILEKMRDPNIIKSIKPAKEFKAKLRPYQQKGLNWLFLLHSLGFGACLADDMGLGKTIQVLAFLQTMIKKDKQAHPSLLILPASLLSNWAAEIEKFSPSLKYLIAHSSCTSLKNLSKIEESSINQFDLVITTYGLAKRYDWIKNHRWNYVILDEAQAIKNPNTAQTKAVKQISSKNRLVLTGTPIENSLSDLWSIFDFLNPGLLGNRTEFSALNKKINEGRGNYGQLRNVIGPYILRRLKTDKSIISDLPDKIEFDTYSTLSKRQTVLYQELVDKLEKSIENADGIQRRGIILASLMKFKQICNHPDQYLGQNTFHENESGKFARLKELCQTIFEKREKVLIFTQFREMATPLSQLLSTIFKKEGLILHGGTPIAKRKKLVADFQSDDYIPYFILSLKAGGTGLNLTAANHVIHFDRWWNPAVENQATDRAFRIGQSKSVIVHKFITEGTIEDKIAMLISNKKKLASEIIGGSNEQWITEMNDKDLINLFRIEKNLL